MPCVKPLQPFACDLLYYLDRYQLERFSIVCRSLKNFIARYFHSKPYLTFDQLSIYGGLYALIHKDVQWHPNRDDYSVQQFFARQKCSKIEMNESTNLWDDDKYYSFAEMHPYLGPAIRIATTFIYVGGNSTHNPEGIAEIESISYLWRENNLHIRHANADFTRILSEDFHPIFNSPTFLQCKYLTLVNAHFSFKDYKILYTVKVIEIFHFNEDEIELWQQYLLQFLEQAGIKPVVVFHLSREKFNNLLSRISKAFSSAVLPNAFKIVFTQFKDNEHLTEFRETNWTLREKLELKKGLPEDNEKTYLERFDNWTLKRSGF